MNANELANEGIVTQLAVVHTMLPKVKELIDNQLAEIESLRMGFVDNGTSDSELAEVRALANRWFLDANRYQWLRNEFANGRETYLAEDIPSGEQLDRYIDEKLRKAQEK
jgi:hypothetical protein